MNRCLLRRCPSWLSHSAIAALSNPLLRRCTHFTDLFTTKKLERTGWTDAHGNGRGQRRIPHTCLQLAGVRVLRLLSACTGRGSACTDARMETGSLQGR